MKYAFSKVNDGGMSALCIGTLGGSSSHSGLRVSDLALVMVILSSYVCLALEVYTSAIGPGVESVGECTKASASNASGHEAYGASIFQWGL